MCSLRGGVGWVRLHELREIELRAVGGWLDHSTLSESLVEHLREVRQRIRCGSGRVLGVTRQRNNVVMACTRVGGGLDPALCLLGVTGGQGLARFRHEAIGQLPLCLPDVGIARRECSSRLDEEPRVILGRLDQHAPAQPLISTAQVVAYPLAELFLLFELLARLGYQGGGVTLACGAVQHRQRPLNVAAGGGLTRLCEHGALTVLGDLRHEKRDAHMIRLDRTRLLGELLRLIEMLRQKLLLRG